MQTIVKELTITRYCKVVLKQYFYCDSSKVMGKVENSDKWDHI